MERLRGRFVYCGGDGYVWDMYSVALIPRNFIMISLQIFSYIVVTESMLDKIIASQLMYVSNI